nr:MAG TPA: hypothetical protein [Bacteriophage sp.]
MQRKVTRKVFGVLLFNTKQNIEHTIKHSMPMT